MRGTSAGRHVNGHEGRHEEERDGRHGKGMFEREQALKERMSGAYLTAEAAMIAPVLIFSVIMLLYLTAHVHNRTCLQASAAEQAISGHEQEAPAVFALAKAEFQRTDSDKERTVISTAGTLYLNGETIWSIKEAAAYKKYHPVKTLRRLGSVKEAAGMEAGK